MMNQGGRQYVPRYRLQLIREGRAEGYPQLCAADAAVRVAREILGDLDREAFLAILLDAKNRVCAANVVHVGALTQSFVHPREVFKAAILANAAGLICAHNHPSGDPGPSDDDWRMTQKLCEAGKLLGIRVLDSIIIGEDGAFYSFCDAGRMPEQTGD